MTGRRVRVDGHEVRGLDAGWEVTSDGPGDAEVDARDWWFRTRFEAGPAAEGEEVVLRFDGIATVSEVFLNGERVLESQSMFAAHEVDVSARLRGDNELEIHCRALAPLLEVRRRPRARWRTRVVANGNLRFFRTTMLGRAPGFAPGPPPVGPWRPVTLERRRGPAVDALALRPRVTDAGDGVLAVRGELRALGGPLPDSVAVRLGEHEARLSVSEGRVDGELLVPAVARWWPHTHGEPVLHDVALLCGETAIDAGRVGFRTLESSADPVDEGLDLHVNGVPVFARGAVWTPVEEPQLRAELERARDAGVNMVRLAGTGVYESRAFHDLCDELGLLVWQDFMFANLDYPIADDAFRAAVVAEADQVLEGIAGRPSLAVMCGNSEVEQQVAMLGLDPALGRGELFGELLPDAVARAGADAIYVPSAPCGGTLPFRPDRGVANYFGVGAYRRPLDDARRAGVRFASECLAFSNVPAEDPEVPVHHPRWKAGVPRDAGAGWDFEDVRDHYLRLLHGVDPVDLRWSDHERYLELSRAVTGEVMAEVFGEWRRAASPCAGGIVLWWRDIAPGAGWGLVDAGGAPKVAYHHLRRALAPVAVWTTDEGLGGVAIHAANDRGGPLGCTLRVALYRDLEQPVGEASERLEIPAHGATVRDLEAMLGHFADVSWAYRFGPPAQDLVAATLEDGGGTVLSQAFRFPAGRPAGVESAARLGLEAVARPAADGAVRLTVRSRRFAYGVRVHAHGFRAVDDDAFGVEPGHERTVLLAPVTEDAVLRGATVGALNLDGRVAVATEGAA